MILKATVLLFFLLSTVASQNPPSECDPAQIRPVCDDATEICVSPVLNSATNKYQCDNHHELQIKATDTNKWKKSAPFKCVNDGSGPKLDDRPIQSGEILGIRCVRMNIKKLYEKTKNECDTRKICDEPLSYDPTVTCPSNLKLHVKTGGGWMKVNEVTCDKMKITVIDANGSPLSTQPDGIRCMGLKCDGYYDNGDCYTTQICKKPNFGSSLADPISCEPDFTLQVKTGGNWEELQQASCNTEKFTASNTDLSLSEGVRCVRMKCSLCDNPCPSPCVSTAKYEKSSILNKCTTFTCGDHSQMKIGTAAPFVNENLICEDKSTPGVFKWKKSDGGTVETNGDVTCEILCTKKTPLTDTCDPNDYLCKETTIGDTGPVTCAATSKLVHKSSADQKETEGSQLDCDKTRGIWKMKKADGTTVVDISQTGNVICKYEECDKTQFCPDCEKEAGSSSKYRCKPEHSVEIRDSPSSDPRSLPSIAFFKCKLGKWKDENDASLVETTTVKCIPITTTVAITTPLPTTPLPEIPKAVTTAQPKADGDSSSSDSQVGMGAGSYALIVLALLILAIGIVCVAFKLTGKGWLHTIILSKLRKGKKKDAKSKAGTPKDAGSPKVSGKASWPAASPRVDSKKAKTGDADDEDGDTTNGTTGGVTETTGGLTGGETEEVTVTEGGVQTRFDV